MVTTRQNYARKIGTSIDKPIGTFDFEEISGLNWTVSDKPLFAQIGEDYIPFPEKKMIVRDDNNSPLGIVGADYQSVQNHDLFELVQCLQEFDSEMIVESAGHFGGGKTVFLQVRMDSLAWKIGDDKIAPNLSIVNGHIGNYNTCIFPSTIRIICQNTLRMAMKKRNDFSLGWKVKHSKNAMDNLLTVKNALKNIALEFEATKEKIDILANTAMNDDDILTLIEATFGEAKSESSRGETRAENRNQKIFDILDSDTSKVSGVEGSLWVGMNAITEYLDHEASVKFGSFETRFENNVIAGPSMNKKEKVWLKALEMAGV